MADVKFLSNLVIDGNIDLTAGAGYQIKNASFESLTADPTTNLFEGRMIYRSDTNEVRAYNGSSWGSIAGDIVGVTAGDGLGGGGTSGTVTLSVNVDDATIELNSDTVRAKTAAVTDGGTALATGGQIFTYIDNQGYTTNTGTVTSVGITAGNLIDVTGSTITTSGTFTIDVDLSELTDMTANVVTTQDEIVLLDNGVQRRKLFSEVFGALAYLGAVSTAHIADLNVTTGKLAADAVTGAKIADNAIDSEHYTDGSIDAAHLASNSVTSVKIAADAVTAAKIADDAISDEHLDVTAITGQTDLGDAFADADTLLVYDASATALVEGTVKNLANYMQDELTFTTNTDTDVSVSNLETRLGQINSNVTIGNGASVAVSTSGNLTVGGNLIVDGTTTTVNSTTVTIDDHHFKVATDNSAANDFGFYGRYNSTAEYAGLTYDVSADTWILYSGNSTEPGNTTFAPDARAGLKVARIDATAFTLNGTGVTSTAAELNILDGVTATTTELNYVDGVTSAIQTQINGKQATITGGATTITSSNLTASRALVSNSSGKVAVSAVTSTELGYLDGVTSAIQTQLNGKQGTLTAGDGIDISSNTISVDLTGSDSIGALAADTSGTAVESADYILIARNGESVERVNVDDLGVSTSNASFTGKGIVELATVNETLTGTDGTRAVTPQGLAGTKYIATIGDGTATSYTVTHSLGSRRVMVQLYDSSSYEQVYAQVVRTTSSAITVDFNTAPTTNDITVLVELIN